MGPPIRQADTASMNRRSLTARSRQITWHAVMPFQLPEDTRLQQATELHATIVGLCALSLSLCRHEGHQSLTRSQQRCFQTSLLRAKDSTGDLQR